jgi:hypothetical protein
MTVSGVPGTGTITLNAAVSQFASFAEAGAVDGSKYTYVIEDGNDFEIGQGTYTASGTTFTRDTVFLSKISGVAGTSKLTLTGNATISLTIAKEDLQFASQAQAEAGTAQGVLMDPLRTAQAIAVLSPPGQPIPSSSTDFKVGTLLLCFNVSGSSISNGSSVAGSVLGIYNDSATMIGVGTWKCVANRAVPTTGTAAIGYFVRTA